MTGDRIVAFVCVLLWVCGCADSDRQRDIVSPLLLMEQPPSITVGNDKCEFSFPVDSKLDSFVWDVGRLGAFEYWIGMTIKTNGEEHPIAWTYYSSGGPKQHGNFHELVAAGKAEIWQVLEGTYLPLESLTVSTDGNRLSIIMKDKKYISLLFASKPTSATFEIGGGMLVEREGPITINYLVDEDGR